MKWIVEAETLEDMLNGNYSISKELTQCEDCKYSDTFPEDTDNDMPLKCLGIRYGGVYPDWFCEHAERRTDE